MHHDDVAELLDFALQQLQVGDKAEHALAVALADHADDFNAIEVGAGRDKAWDDGVLDVVFCTQDQHAALQGAAFAAWPQIAGGDAGGHVGGDQPLAAIGQAGDEAKLAECKAVRPQPRDGRPS